MGQAAEAAVIAGRMGRVAGAFVSCGSLASQPARGAAKAAQGRRGQQDSRRALAAVRAGLGLGTPGHRAQRLERAATRAVIFVGRHRRAQTSGDSGMSTPFVTDAVGPFADGLMSKSKIAVGSHSVAQAFGMSTTPLM